MDKQLIFFLMLAFLFLIKGIFSLNIMMQLSGIAVILFLIYKTYSNSEKKKVSEERYSKPLSFNFIQFLGNADLVLGLLLLIDISFGFIPHFLLFFFCVNLAWKRFNICLESRYC